MNYFAVIMTIHGNISLQTLNTFGIDVSARWYGRFADAGELEELSGMKPGARMLVLGGGSNILFTGDFDGLVLKNDVKGITQLHEDEEFVYVRAGAGENWHRFVMYCIERNWAGLENLALIPGNVGASPIQNIGAYGVEIDDVFWDLEAWDLADKKLVTFTRGDCEFGYRESVFKKRYPNRFVILNVTYQLRKHPRFHTGYGAIEDELQRMGVQELSIKAIAEAVIRIRSAKLPDPAQIGNAGSFFKNPLVTAEKFQQLRREFAGIVGYENNEGMVKLAAGWLIEHCGPSDAVSWKGYRKGDAGCHEKQALVLVNHGKASGAAIFELSSSILKSVEDKFGVVLEREVNII